jgi:ankyrin repeat protein
MGVEPTARAFNKRFFHHCRSGTGTLDSADIVRAFCGAVVFFVFVFFFCRARAARNGRVRMRSETYTLRVLAIMSAVIARIVETDEEEAQRKANLALWLAVERDEVAAVRAALGMKPRPNVDIMRCPLPCNEENAWARSAIVSRADGSAVQLGLDNFDDMENDLFFLRKRVAEAVEETDDGGWQGFSTPLMISRDIEIVRMLIDAGATIDLMRPSLVYGDGYGYGGHTALHIAVCEGDFEKVKALVKAGADVDIRIDGHSGYEDIPCPEHTPLLLAVSEAEFNPKHTAKFSAIAKFLVESGADVNAAACANSGGQGEDTSLRCYWFDVIASGDVKFAVELMEKYDADPNWPKCFKGWNGHDFGMSHGDCNDFKGAGETVLIVAIERNDYAMVEALLQHGADPKQHAFFKLKDEIDDDDDDEEWPYKRVSDLPTPLSVAERAKDRRIFKAISDAIAAAPLPASALPVRTRSDAMRVTAAAAAEPAAVAANSSAAPPAKRPRTDPAPAAASLSQ